MLLVGCCLVVGMAVYAAECLVIAWRGMAIGTCAPYACMPPGINRKVLRVVHQEGRRLPSGVGGMTGHAGCWDARNDMVRVVGCIISLGVTGETIGRRPCEAVHMAQIACGGEMRSGKREFTVIVVESSLNAACGMALKTCQAGECIAAHLLVLAVHIRLVVSMAVDTAVLFQVAGCGMAFTAGAPCACMLSRVNRKKLGIMSLVISGPPAWICRMAIGTTGGETCGDMIRVRCSIVICLVAGNTFL